MTWQEEIADKWSAMITEDGDDFETVALVSLQYAALLVEAALAYPEWAAGFLRMAVAAERPAEQYAESTAWIVAQFPVAMPV